MPCENCVSRRAFLAAAAGAATVALGGCGDGIISGIPSVPLPPGGAPTGTVTITVANFPGLATEGTLVKVSGFYAAKRTGASTFAAFSMVCTHEGCPIEITQAGHRFDCPCHGSAFDSDGSVLQGPAERPLQGLSAVYNASTDTLTIN